MPGCFDLLLYKRRTYWDRIKPKAEIQHHISINQYESLSLKSRNGNKFYNDKQELRIVARYTEMQTRRRSQLYLLLIIQLTLVRAKESQILAHRT